MSKPIILGLSASLRAARSKAGAKNLAAEITALPSRERLDDFLGEQAKIHLDQFVEAGRKDGLPFDQIYRRLQKTEGLRGLSNSEITLAAALWGVCDQAGDINHIALSNHFRADGTVADLEALKQALIAADGILLSTPVYFGDRGSLSQRLIEMIRADDGLQKALAGKVYGGLAVGAKRNGGQETTLIYQMLDMLDIGLLGVGNDSDTTAQYGGTTHAGDIGTSPKDSYGINTSIGTGRRIARVAAELGAGKQAELSDLPRLGVWLLQDRGAEMAARLAPFLDSANADVSLLNPVGRKIRPCIACDICPTHIGPDEEYRCIIGRRDDAMKDLHDSLLTPDILLPALFSPKRRDELVSVYQEFMERTRYLRRGDYVFTDRLVAPLIFAELGSGEHLDVRVMTSFIRHHTVMCRPITGWLKDGKLINAEDVEDGIARAVANGRRLTAGRLASSSLELTGTQYRPVGYVLAQAKDNEAQAMNAREEAVDMRRKRLAEEARRRLAPVRGSSKLGAA
ncbi:MAG: NAD(P)H-dependent oxidoreductase [Alphaproteobacteria bacterium]|jgi:multimeric flavodoxin WrbA|nr:NAD(P)H-dependent oxidoreductase [Alphaproteobacteria bacterium]